MDEDRNVVRKPASDEEKKMLRNFVARPATEEERDGFLIKNAPHLNDKARGVFIDMSPTDQFRVMFDGPMKDCRDAVEILYGRVKRFMDMEMQLRALSSRSGTETESRPKKQPSAKMQELSKQIAHSLANPKFEEVPESERRCAGVDQKLEEEKKPAIIEGTVKGVGGVIEALQKKYAMQKGERIRVVAETKDLWKLAGEKTVPKSQVNSGYKWVIKGAEEEAKKKAEQAARKKAEKEEAERKKKEEEEAKKAQEGKEKHKRTKSEEKKKSKAPAKSKKRKHSSSSSDEAEDEEEDESKSESAKKRSRRKERSQAKGKRRKEADKDRKGRRKGSSEDRRSPSESESSRGAKRKARERSRRRR